MVPPAAVFILNYNGLKSLGEILFRSVESALRISYEGLEVVVIDNGSSDGSFEELENRFRGDVALIRLDKNYGYAGGNEAGIRRYIEARGRIPDLAVIMNNDFIVTNPDFLRDIAKPFSSDPQSVIAQGITLNVVGRIESAGMFQDIMLQQVNRCGDLSISECPEKPSYITFALGALMILKLRTVLASRGYIFRREHFILWEETELAMSMWRRGFRSVAYPVVTGIHYGTATVKRAMPLAWYAGRRNKYYVYRSALGRYSKALGLYMPIASEYLNTALRILQGYRGKMAVRGFIDSFRVRPAHPAPSAEPYEPLLLIPRSYPDLVFNLLTAPLKRINEEYGYLGRLKTLTIDREKLSDTPRPFLVYV